MSAPSKPAAVTAALNQENDAEIESAGGLWTKRPGTRVWVLACGGIAVLLTVALWKPIQHSLTRYLLLRAESPSEEVLSQVVSEARHPAPLLKALWDTQRIPHRQFVLAHLDRLASSDPTLFGRLEPSVLEATSDPDIEVRQLAFAILQRLKHAQLKNLALHELSDADPAARLLGLQNLRGIATSNEVPVVMSFLTDPEPRVVVAAALLLQRATGQSFSIKSSDALPQFTCLDTNPPPSLNLGAIRQGVERCQDWWSLHRTQYQSVDVPTLSQSADIKLTN